MILKTVYVRFYKSFNYDYLRKHHKLAKRRPWELMDALWYPFVKVPIDPTITTVVGANESGKSHLLSAIEKGITGKKISREDFCRYSQFFTVEKGKMRLPDFGFEFTSLSPDEVAVVAVALGQQDHPPFSEFHLFRFNASRLVAYLGSGDACKECEIQDDKAAALEAILPHVFRIDSNVALPASVPIQWLVKAGQREQPNKFELLDRQRRVDMFGFLADSAPQFQTAQTVQQNAEGLAKAFAPLAAAIHPAEELTRRQQEAEYRLAWDLICTVSKTDPIALDDLYKAIREGNDGHANGIIERINATLAKVLNFPRWWVQDRDFRLLVSAREHDLVFTIRDKTETEYSFGERSSGLRFFLSYYIQYLAYKPSTTRQEILLMDEPDAYLSSQAQQDLLKIFAAFATGTTERSPVQVLYVTHSPFLIDKNHSERIRVLEKGSGDEGTRVIKNAVRNHYEPLRSAFGAFVGEMVFIGNCNLVAEGPADQILLAGATTTLIRRGANDLETLDLNRMTIVPAGSANHVHYMVFLARGRDVEQPALIVLLDSDAAGNAAKSALKTGTPRGRKLIKEEFILQIADIAGSLAGVPSGAPKIVELEDLIPLPICVRAAKRYIKEFDGDDAAIALVGETEVVAQFKDGKSVFDAVEAVMAQPPIAMHLDKVGFARAVCATVTDLATNDPSNAALIAYEGAMKTLFLRLSTMQRAALKEMNRERVSKRIQRLKDAFFQDFPTAVRRIEATQLCEEIETRAR